MYLFESIFRLINNILNEILDKIFYYKVMYEEVEYNNINNNLILVYKSTVDLDTMYYYYAMYQPNYNDFKEAIN